MSVSRRWVAGGVVITAALAGGGIAVAHHGPDSIFPTANTISDCVSGTEADGMPCLADNTSHTVYVGSLGSQFTAATRWTLDGSYGPGTDLTIQYEASPDLSGGSETDVIYRTSDVMDTGIYGMAWCDDDVDGTARCDQHYVQYHRDKILAAFGDYFTGGNANAWRTIACHESGHAVGLLHGAQASPRMADQDPNLRCMERPLDTPPDPYVGSHNVGLINSEV